MSRHASLLRESSFYKNIIMELEDKWKMIELANAAHNTDEDKKFMIK